MKQLTLIAALAAVIVAGCGPKEDTAGTPSNTTGSTSAPLVAIGYDQGTKKKGDKGVCAVCMIKEGKQPGEEEAKEVLDFGGKTYIFCDEAEKAEFIADTKKYTGQ